MVIANKSVSWRMLALGSVSRDKCKVSKHNLTRPWTKRLKKAQKTQQAPNIFQSHSYATSGTLRHPTSWNWASCWTHSQHLQRRTLRLARLLLARWTQKFGSHEFTWVACMAHRSVGHNTHVAFWQFQFFKMLVGFDLETPHMITMAKSSLMALLMDLDSPGMTRRQPWIFSFTSSFSFPLKCGGVSQIWKPPICWSLMCWMMAIREWDIFTFHPGLPRLRFLAAVRRPQVHPKTRLVRFLIHDIAPIEYRHRPWEHIEFCAKQIRTWAIFVETLFQS